MILIEGSTSGDFFGLKHYWQNFTFIFHSIHPATYRINITESHIENLLGSRSSNFSGYYVNKFYYFNKLLAFFFSCLETDNNVLKCLDEKTKF